MNRKSLLIRTASTLMVAATLGACAQAPVHATATTKLASCPPQPGIALNVNEAVLYYTCVASLSAPALVTEYNATRESYTKTASDSDRIRLAMLLSLPDTPFHSTAETLKLLQDPPANPASPPQALHNLARMLSLLFTEQQRNNNTVDDLAKALAAEKAHSEFLQGKIDAVKNLEINMIHRDQP
jgi:hypothetical protein